ncbi:hypothetical protein ACF3OC_07860 [Sphingobacterium cellulitidis]
MKYRALIMIALILSMASCSKDECPEPEKPKKEKCAGCSNKDRPNLEHRN